MINDLVVIGAGGLGREVLWQILECPDAQKYRIQGFVDDAKGLENQTINGYPVLGGIPWLKRQTGNLSVVIAIGNAKVRKKIAEELKDSHNLSYPNIIAKNVTVAGLCDYGKGCIFCVGTIVTVNVAIGDFFISNPASTVGHDCGIGDYVTLYPSVNVSGNVRIGDASEIGVGTQIIQGKKVGSGTIVGAGAVVIDDLPDNCTAVGVPAKVIKRNGAYDL